MIAVREPKKKVRVMPRVYRPVRLSRFLSVQPPPIPKPKPQLIYAPTVISACGKRYLLHEPLICPIKYIAEDEYYSIEHEGLSIFCGGDTVEEACQEFNEWFVSDYLDHSKWNEAYLGMYQDAFRLMKRLIKEEL